MKHCNTFVYRDAHTQTDTSQEGDCRGTECLIEGDGVWKHDTEGNREKRFPSHFQASYTCLNVPAGNGTRDARCFKGYQSPW